MLHDQIASILLILVHAAILCGVVVFQIVVSCKHIVQLHVNRTLVSVHCYLLLSIATSVLNFDFVTSSPQAHLFILITFLGAMLSHFFQFLNFITTLQTMFGAFFFFFFF